MRKQRVKRIVDVEELKAYGVPEEFFEPARYLAERGAFEVEPPQGLLKQTIAACVAELKKKAPTDPGPLMELQTIGASGAMWPVVRDFVSELRRMGPLPATCAESMWYCLSNPEPPLMIVENHNVLSPALWKAKELSQVWKACRRINLCATSLQGPVSVHLVVLKNRSGDYSDSDLEQISAMHQDANSDVYWISSKRAGTFAKQGELVVGDIEVLTLRRKPSSAHEAVEMLLQSRTEDSGEALSGRARIQETVDHAVPIIIHGTIVPEFRVLLSTPSGVRKALEQVICAIPGDLIDRKDRQTRVIADLVDR